MHQYPAISWKSEQEKKITKTLKIIDQKEELGLATSNRQ